MLDVKTFDSLKTTLATGDNIVEWSHGEVKKPETTNYRMLKPERGGLFGEQIFGPTRDWECVCDKYKRVRYKGIVYEKCGVEVTRSRVRRERMGYIDLTALVTYIWYFKGAPSRLGHVFDPAPKDLEKVTYFAAYMITRVDRKGRHGDLAELRTELEVQKKQMGNNHDATVNDSTEQSESDMAALEKDGISQVERERARKQGGREMARIHRRFDGDIESLEAVWERLKDLKVGDLEGDERFYRAMAVRYGTYFKGDMGAAIIQKRLEAFDLEAEAAALRQIVASNSGPHKAHAIKCLKVISAFVATGNPPAPMVLAKIPVIPPNLRPMAQLDGGRFAVSDLNDLYCRVINRNARLKRLSELGAPEIIVSNEKRMLQEFADALLDNGRRGRPVAGPGNRSLKSISDMFKGRQGRFCQNLLGKRVNYSGRPVIVVGPQLQLHQCGLPKQMALKPPKPFVMKRLVEKNYAQNVKVVKRKVERQRPEVRDVLDDIIREHPVLLNHAPTLHRLGIQAFEPQLIEGRAIQLHPLACGVLNADFDGDQMAAHLPLGAEVQAEARILMPSTNNTLKPSNGRPVAMPLQDMIIGLFYLISTPDPSVPAEKDEDGNSAIPYFPSQAETQTTYDAGNLHLNATARIRFADGTMLLEGWEAPEGWEPGDELILETSFDRAISNEQLPTDYPFINEVVDKKQLGNIVNMLTQCYPDVLVADCLDALKLASFHRSTWSGTTIAFSDIQASLRKREILARYEVKAAEIVKQFEMGIILEKTRHEELVKLRLQYTEEVADDMRANPDERNTMYRMVNPGVRGNWSQVQRVAGMRGLVSDSKQKLIEQPIKANYREGPMVLEHFIITHGARKGLADTALCTVGSGYLIRRLVDASQDVIVREVDCGICAGLKIDIVHKNEFGGWEVSETIETTAYTRNLARDAMNEIGEVAMSAGTDLGDDQLAELVAVGVEQIVYRPVLIRESQVGTCAACYGRSLVTSKQVDIGEVAGIIAAQSIGEPDTQLTVRTFHTGGAASAADTTQGLPRVQELFEARSPKVKAKMNGAVGRVHIGDEDPSARKVVITRDDGKEDLAIEVSHHQKSLISRGQHIEAGTPPTEGQLDPKEILRIMGRNVSQKMLVDEVQRVYRDQGVGIHAKYIEVIVRQMLHRVTILEPGDTTFMPDELVDRMAYLTQNRCVTAEDGQPASGRQMLTGITKASLAMDSWLSAASFQEIIKVLIEAVMNGKSDSLVGPKGNVILGKLIPVGTGLSRYDDIIVEPTAEVMANLNYSEADLGDSSVPEDFLDALGAIDFGMNFRK